MTAAIEELSGVVRAELGAYSTGPPNDYGLRVTMTVHLGSTLTFTAEELDQLSL